MNPVVDQKTGRVYSAKVRRQAVAALSEGAGHRALASKLGIPDATARQWARAYAVGGRAAVLEVMIKHGIPSESSVKTWCRQYREHGAEALVNKPRGVKPKNRPLD